MYLYNSATHRKEEFKTHTPGHVEMYTCGPTIQLKYFDMKYRRKRCKLQMFWNTWKIQ